LAWPLLISVPHAGLRVPPEVRSDCILTKKQVRAESDGGAKEIYGRLRDDVTALVTTDVARVIVDVNRAEDDRRADGVVKTETWRREPVYDPFPSPAVVKKLLADHYEPYHVQLCEFAATGVRLGIDCHTMEAVGPPIAPDAGAKRPWVCLSNADESCPPQWLAAMAASLEVAFDHPISINKPYPGGYITRSRPGGIPWMQIELSRDPYMSLEEKRRAVREGLHRFCDRMATQHWRLA